MNTKEKEYTIYDVLSMGYNLTPLKCVKCGYVGEVTYYQNIGDAQCEKCGAWQIGED